MQTFEQWPLRYTKFIGLLAVEAPESVFFSKYITQRRYTVFCFYSFDMILTSIYNVTRVQFNCFNVKFQFIKTKCRHNLGKFLNPIRPIDVQGFSSAIEIHCLDQTWNTKKMVCMKMSDKNGCQVTHTCLSAHHLLLSTFTAVE